MHEVLPPGHALIQRWDACLKDQVGEKTAYLTYDGLVDTLRGTFSAAYDMLSKGRLSSFVGCIRAETVGDLLHQADNLAEQIRGGGDRSCGGSAGDFPAFRVRPKQPHLARTRLHRARWYPNLSNERRGLAGLPRLWQADELLRPTRLHRRRHTRSDAPHPARQGRISLHPGGSLG